MEIIEHTFAELSQLKYRIYTTFLPNVPNRSVLIVAFEGKYGIGCKGNDDAEFINAIVVAARAAWQSSCFVLDYRAMEYEWGDRLLVETGHKEITQETAAVLRAFGGMPDCSATLVSDLNREATSSLLGSEYGYGSDSAWLFDDLDAALAAFESVWRQFQAEKTNSA